MPKRPTPNTLTPKERVFVDEWLVDMNGTRAAIAAGYAPKHAKRTAHEVMQRPQVLAAIQAAQQARAKRTEITADRVLIELGRVAFFDPRKLLNADGSPKPINELDDDTAAALAGLDIAEEWEGAGKDRKFVGYTRKVRIVDKNGALGLAMRHLGMLRDRTEITGKEGGPVQTEATVSFYIPENGR